LKSISSNGIRSSPKIPARISNLYKVYICLWHANDVENLRGEVIKGLREKAETPSFRGQVRFWPEEIGRQLNEAAYDVGKGDKLA